MLPLWLNQVRGDDKPDLIVASNDYFTFYEASQVAIKRYTNAMVKRRVALLRFEVQERRCYLRRW
jgi:hypothetical protein